MNGFLAPEQDYSRSVAPASQSAGIAKAYMNMKQFNTNAIPAYRQMAEEVGRQFDFMTKPTSKGGLGVHVPEAEDEDPYGMRNGQFEANKVLPDVRADVENNNQMRVLSTKSTGGHPVFTNDQNDMFRAVHDYFGHLGSGRGIDAHGEDAAYQKHAAMFSPLARGALATETRGQNNVLRQTGGFPEQKVGILPTRMHKPSNLSGAQFSDYQDAALENRKQGLA
jgi:hypothetical protein